MLCPTPVGARSRSRAARESAPVIVRIERFGVTVLIPHRIGDDVIESFQARALGRKSWLVEGINR